MGQRHSEEQHQQAYLDVDSPYASKEVHELERLAQDRGLVLPRPARARSSSPIARGRAHSESRDRGREPGQPDRALLTTLLLAYDAGIRAATASPLHRREGRESSRAVEFGALSGVQQQQVADPSVLAVLQQIRDAPGHMGVDIGGTLVKMALALPLEAAADCEFPDHFGSTGCTHQHLEFGMRLPCGERRVVRFISGSTSLMEQAVRHLGVHRSESKNKLDLEVLSTEAPTSESTCPFDEDDDEELVTPKRGRSISDFSGWSDVGSAAFRPVRRIATAGGGACKFAPLFRDALRVEIEPVKELAAVVDGLLLLASQHKEAALDRKGDASAAAHDAGSLFTVDEDGTPKLLPWPEPLFPLILVNMGSGVSILRVDSASPNDYVRVGGTACGGGTFLGLSRALSSAQTFEEALGLADGGDASKADKLVRDIYGEDGSASLGLSATLTACNFGRLSEPHWPDDGGCSEEDLVRSLLQMVTQQSVLLGTAFARHAGCIDRVFFVGGFVDEANRLARATIAGNFRRLGGCAYFLRHSDFLGALGSLKCAVHASSDECESEVMGA